MGRGYAQISAFRVAAGILLIYLRGNILGKVPATYLEKPTTKESRLFSSGFSRARFVELERLHASP